MNRRQFLLATLATTAKAAAAQTFVAGVVPAGRARASGLAAIDPVETYWNNCDQVSRLGFHHVEINNTRARIAELYLDRISEFKDEMAKRHLTLAGLALFSHIAAESQRQDLIDQHMLLGRFLAAVGGKYITHMIAPGAVLNEPEDDEAYRDVDVKVWARNGGEVGKRLLDQWDVKLAYHPEQGEVRSGLYEQILAATDERYFYFLPDLGHIASGGADTVEVCKKYRSRLACVHLKDFARVPENGQPAKAGNVTFGQGTANIEGVVQVLRKSKFNGFLMAESGGTNQAMHDYLTNALDLDI